MLNKLIPKMLSNPVLGLTFLLLIICLQGQRWQWSFVEHQFLPVLPPDFYNLCSKTCSGSAQLAPEFCFPQRFTEIPLGLSWQKWLCWSFPIPVLENGKTMINTSQSRYGTFSHFGSCIKHVNLLTSLSLIMYLKIVVRSWKGNCKSPLWSLLFGAQQKA